MPVKELYAPSGKLHQCIYTSCKSRYSVEYIHVIGSVYCLVIERLLEYDAIDNITSRVRCKLRIEYMCSSSSLERTSAIAGHSPSSNVACHESQRGDLAQVYIGARET